MSELVRQLVKEISEISRKVYLLNIYEVVYSYTSTSKVLKGVKVFKNMNILNEYKEGLLRYLENNGVSGRDNSKFIGYTSRLYYELEIDEGLIDDREEYEGLHLVGI